MSHHTIPIVDLSDYTSGDATKKANFVKAIGQAYEEFGFVSVTNHGIPDEVVSEYYRCVEEFFALPTDEKIKYEIKELAGQRGYTSFGREHAKGSEAPDLKEFWQMGQIIEDGDPIKSEYPDNVQVNEITNFNELGEKLYKSFEKTGTVMLRAIANFLHLDENYFDKHVHNGNSILRAIHYPPISSEPKSAIRAEQHEDINLITLLVGASAEGLQLLDKKNEWLPITAPEGCIIVNVGDMLQRLTNNKLSSTTHRVVNPKRELWHTHRYSIPFFMHPRSEMDLTCLESCVDANNPLHYEPITAGDYLTERLIEIGLLKK
jgi:isopenicillin N synthase-like dioxygenase